MPFENPFGSDHFTSAAIIIASLLGGTFLSILALNRFSLSGLGTNALFQRWRAWVVIAPLFAFCVLSGQVPLALLLGAAVVIGLVEYARLVGLPQMFSRFLIASGVLAVIGAAISIDIFLLLPSVLLIVATLQPLLFRGKSGVRHFAFAVLGWSYIAWFLGHLLLIQREIDGGEGLLLAIALGVGLSDVMAFTVGKAIGGPKLAPRISPNKTWAGFAGNFLGAYAGVGLMFFALPSRMDWQVMSFMPIVIAIGSVWGDLLESSIKREFEVKDAGTWLPGFGGLLDRIDSLIIVGPLAFYFIRLVENWPPALLGIN
ncbi:MAG: phosphatidate cytidylyltransferase [Chloroflexi bacterium]|nr:phosphatidate cytidylyltransferase [Chloroflexota bacterium]